MENSCVWVKFWKNLSSLLRGFSQWLQNLRPENAKIWKYTYLELICFLCPPPTPRKSRERRFSESYACFACFVCFAFVLHVLCFCLPKKTQAVVSQKKRRKSINQYKKIADKYELYLRLLLKELDEELDEEDSNIISNIDTFNINTPQKRVLDRLNITRYCCKRHFISQVNLIDKI